MSTLAAARTREPLVDALRALAVLGVFIVNLVGYAQAPDHPMPLGAPLPAGSTGALVVHGLLVALVQGKAWPLLCFLFGYSLCSLALKLRGQGRPVQALLRSRYRKLLAIGIVHGALLYFGDILTGYALCALIAASWTTTRPARLLRIWRWLGALVLVLLPLNGLLLWLWRDAAEAPISSAGALLASEGFWPFEAINTGIYIAAQIDALLLFWPMLLWLTVSGVLARRLRLLGTRRTARRFWARHASLRQLHGALLLNLALGAASMAIHLHGVGDRTQFGVLFLVGVLPGIWLVANVVGWVVRRQQSRSVPAWIVWLAPAGQHTLVMYLLLSASMALGRGLLRGLAGNTAATLALAVLAWCMAVLAARAASAAGLRDPLARWLSTGSAGSVDRHADVPVQRL